MKIDTQAYIPLELHSAVRAHSKLGPIWPDAGSDLHLSWPSVEFDCLIRLAVSAGVGFRLSSRLVLDEAESAGVELWQMHFDSYPTSNDRDQRWRAKTWESLPFVDGTRHVRRFDSYRISKSPAKSRRILGDGGAFFFPDALVNALAAAQLDSGARWEPVFGFQTEAAWPEAKLLVAENLMGPVAEDPSMLWSSGDGDYEFLIPRAGALAMHREVLRKAQDFNLTTEPTGGYNVGTTMVSSRVRQMITNGYRGVFFTPVFEADGKLHRSFLAQWLQLESDFSPVPRGRLR